jgi:outer membrane protein assembly factor BamD (BamD/ComL family)
VACVAIVACPESALCVSPTPLTFTQTAQTGERRAERLEYDADTGVWIAIAPPVPGTEDGDLEIARQLLARNEFAKARRALDKWRKTYPESTRWLESLFYAADVEVMNMEATGYGDLRRAYRWYEAVIDNLGGSDLADRAIRREMLIAELFLFKGKKQWVFRGLLKVSAIEEGLMILDRITVEHASGTLLAENALRLKAQYHFQAGEFDLAEQAYAQLARDFPRGRYERLALLRSADAAFARFPGINFDDSALLEAEERYSTYQQRYPEAARGERVGDLLTRISETRAEKELSTGRYYERTGTRRAAVYYYRYVVDSWPGSAAALDARSRLAALGERAPDELAPMPDAIQENAAPDNAANTIDDDANRGDAAPGPDGVVEP